jgi:transcriptional regulator with XRE-family HTH domain
MNLGRAIKLCRTQKNLKQSQLAKKAKLSVSYLSLLEQEKRDPPFSTVEKIAGALDVPVSILMFLATDKEEISEISPELAEKLAYTALRLISSNSDESTEV